MMTMNQPCTPWKSSLADFPLGLLRRNHSLAIKSIAAFGAGWLRLRATMAGGNRSFAPVATAGFCYLACGAAPDGWKQQHVMTRRVEC
jgi:hypothetical protein